MVAAVNVGKDAGRLDLFRCAVRAQEVVDAPAGVVLPRVEAVAPPRVGVRLVRMQGAERVREAGVQQLLELRALLGAEAGVADVALRVFQIDLRRGNVHVPADDDRLVPVERADELAERIVPAHPVFQPAQAVLGVRRVDAYEVEFRVFGCDHPALEIMLRQAEVILHVERLGLRKNGGAGVALFLGAAPVLVVARQVERDLPRLELCLLQTENVRVQRAERVRKALGHTGAQPVDVPGYKSHFVSSVFTATQRLIVMP